MTWARATKERLLTPRPCPRCGQYMSLAFLIERAKQRGEKIRASLLATVARGGRIGRKPLQIQEEVLKLRREGYSYKSIAIKLGHTVAPIRRICTAAGLNKLGAIKRKPDINMYTSSRSTDTDGNRPWLEYKK